MQIILDRTLYFHPEDDKTNFCIDFQLSEPYDALHCACAYSPKTVRDMNAAKQAIEGNIGKYIPREQLKAYENWETALPIVNLLTFSLDHAGEYIGCAHRHGSHLTHVISEHESSPGFFRHKVAPGKWRAVINLHCIVSPEVVYQLTISAWKKEEVSHGN